MASGFMWSFNVDRYICFTASLRYDLRTINPPFRGIIEWFLVYSQKCAAIPLNQFRAVFVTLTSNLTSTGSDFPFIPPLASQNFSLSLTPFASSGRVTEGSPITWVLGGWRPSLGIMFSRLVRVVATVRTSFSLWGSSSSSIRHWVDVQWFPRLVALRKAAANRSAQVIREHDCG